MAVMNVNPTRMELKRLKGRLKTATRGYELLKDKTDEMVRQFIIIAKRNKQLREKVEASLVSVLRSFAFAKSVSDETVIAEALLMPSKSLKLECANAKLMNVAVPSIQIKEDSHSVFFPYSFLSVTDEMDVVITDLNKVLKDMIQLAEVEKTCNMLAIEIEKNKRRVNALENIMIPQMQETIKYITMKLDENERASTVRLMKVKAIIQNSK